MVYLSEGCTCTQRNYYVVVDWNVLRSVNLQFSSNLVGFLLLFWLVVLQIYFSFSSFFSPLIKCVLENFLFVHNH